MTCPTRSAIPIPAPVKVDDAGRLRAELALVRISAPFGNPPAVIDGRTEKARANWWEHLALDYRNEARIALAALTDHTTKGAK